MKISNMMSTYSGDTEINIYFTEDEIKKKAKELINRELTLREIRFLRVKTSQAVDNFIVKIDSSGICGYNGNK